MVACKGKPEVLLNLSDEAEESNATEIAVVG